MQDKPETWPITPVDQDITLELKDASRGVVVTNVVSHWEPVIKIEDYSSLYRLYRVVAFVLRYKKNCLASFRKEERIVSDMTLDEYKEAQKVIIRQEQMQIRNKDKYELQKKSLNLFEDEEGIIRVKGRLENSTLDDNAKYPIFLHDSHFVHLLIRKSHNEIWHGGTEHSLAKFRCRFWIVRGKQIVARTIHRCVVCKRQQGKVLLPPPSPALPEFRVSTDYCFQTTGVDFAGPLLVKEIFDTDGTLYKAYICLFTCAASRTVHLELTPNLEAESFIRAFKRFSARRGTPSRLISDNAKTFASLLLKSFLLRKEVESTHILPASPWWGGFYERLVKSVKLPLKKVLGRAKLSYEEMETVLIEVEGVVNSRPLTYLHEDDTLEPLTPFHLLHGRNLSTKSNNPSIVSPERSSEDLTRRLKYLQTTIQSYWQRFQHVYLAELREHHMYVSKRRTSERNILRVGDVVVIKPESSVTPRNSWRLGRVDSLVVGEDGHVRGANLITRSMKGCMSAITRPLQKIVPFEILPESVKSESIDFVHTPVSNVQTTSSPEDITSSDSILPRQRRACAIAGEQHRREMNQE